jgi:hypothetical protein
MKSWIAAAIIMASLTCGAEAAENRCGWLQNPTPANWWLDDADGSWTIMTQGAGDEPEGMDLIPDISERDYVKTNGNYGYACACMNVETDGNDHITAIYSVRQLSLSKCKKDPSLSAPG